MEGDDNNPSPVSPRGCAKADSNQNNDTFAPTEVKETLNNLLRE